MAEVIVLSDSDASCGGGTAPASAATSPAASPAGRVQSVGYADAVEAALAMAAAFETQGSASQKKKETMITKKQKRVKPAPPLLSVKTKKPRANQPQPAVQQKQTAGRAQSRQRQRPAKGSRARYPPSSPSSISSLSSDSDSSFSSRSEAGRRRLQRASNALRRPKPTADSVERRRRLEGASSRRRERERSRAPTATPKPVDVVDLMSSSSSSSSSSMSDSSAGGRARSSSLSSLTSSGDESSISSVKSGKKRLVLNNRVLGKRPVHSSLQPARKKAAASRPLLPSQAVKKPTGVVVVAPRQGKRKRVLPHMQRQSEKRGRLPQHELTKKATNFKKPVMKGVLHRGSYAKPAIAAQSSDLSMASSSSSSTESSPASSPRPLPSRKSAASLTAGLRAPPAPMPKPLPSRKTAATLSSARVREGEMDAFGRYRCRKSVSVNEASPRPTSAQDLSSPSPSPRKKRRGPANTYFDTDRVALNDLQAQERELALIRSYHKQTKGQARPARSSALKTKTEPDVISVEEHSGTNSTAFSEESQMKNQHLIVAEMDSAAAEPRLASMLIHPTSYRGIYLEKAPTNILPLRSAAFDSRCDHPLTFYDGTDTLASQCAILESFGKPTQCISSVFPSEVAKPQSEVTRAVGALVAAHLPIIRSCHKRKMQAILTEARQKLCAYRTALMKHRRALREQDVTAHALPRKAAEKYAVKQLKGTQHSCSLSAGSVSFQIGRGDGFVREKSVSSLIQINRINEVRPLRKYTTSIGVRENYRVDDDPILRYTAITRRNSGDGGGEAARKYAVRVGSLADEEVMEYVLRLVVGRLGDSEQVFQALKSELDFSQAYTAYCELKKLHDSRQRASTRIDQVEKLKRDGLQALDPDVAAIVNLMEQASLSKCSRKKVLSRRLQPPIGTLESSLVDCLVDGATAGMAALGLRSMDNYADLVDVYCGSFCRMCYNYACHEHGGDHPLPARRVDPVYPQLRPGATPIARVVEANLLDLSEDEVVCLGTDPSTEAEAGRAAGMRSNAQGAVTAQSAHCRSSDVDMSGDRQQRKKVFADPSEFVDDSHVPVVATKMQQFLSKSSVCSNLCWKNGISDDSDKRPALSAAEMGVVGKLRETMGDNSCLLAAVIGSASCTELHEFIMKERVSDEGAVPDGRSSRRSRSWTNGRRSGGSNHELLQRTRNQRLQDRGTENHEYKPCLHDGMCDSAACSCIKRDHMCEKACACSRDCPNRFEGCACALGECRTTKCPCFAALRECDPDVCLTCGASEVAADVVVDAVSNGACQRVMCGNVNVTRGKHKRLGMSFSSIHGYGMYACEPIAANDFVYEYTGAMLSQDEAERRGLIYDKMEMSYLFDLNEDAVLDALRSGNKSKFINHDGETPNCTAKVVSVCGVHHISIWALRDIAVSEELVFDYGYKRSVGPGWSQRRAASKDTS